ncbi:unnamed protein product, partial [Musa acuminata subsp. burmannicoides]
RNGGGLAPPHVARRSGVRVLLRRVRPRPAGVELEADGGDPCRRPRLHHAAGDLRSLRLPDPGPRQLLPRFRACADVSGSASPEGNRRRFSPPAASGPAMTVGLESAKEVGVKKGHMKQRRVVVTGMGVVTPLGHDLDTFYSNLLEGVSGVSEIETFDCSSFPTVFNDAIEALRVSYKKMNPFCVPFATTNMGSAMLAMDLGWMGPNYSISTACATSNFCILNAANHIVRGEADVMLCGGSDSVIIPIGLGGFVACRALSQRNNDPAKASRPWDVVYHDGFVMGEGAGVLLLEELDHAKLRGAQIYAEFLGGSFTCDAYHMTEPHPEGTGIVLCIEKALSESGVSREDVNHVNAHATSTLSGDLKEYQALIHCFGKNPKLRVNSTKSMTGHLLGAAGAVVAVAVVQAIRTGWVHPNINLDKPEETVDVDMLVGSGKERLIPLGPAGRTHPSLQVIVIWCRSVVLDRSCTLGFIFLLFKYWC